jgi:hypothetical protein
MRLHQIIRFGRESGLIDGKQDWSACPQELLDNLHDFAERLEQHFDREHADALTIAHLDGHKRGVEAEREACAKKVGEFAQKWWSIHCDSNKHMETTRKAHDDFCALQSAIRARSKP